MKKVLLLAVSFFAVTTASAQISAYKQGNSVSVEGYSLPRTVISVKITQEREVVLRGPYARFASQYLGIATAPMSDKETCKIIDAEVGYYEEPDPKQVFVFDEKSGNPAKIFNWLTLSEPQNETIVAKNADIDFVVPFKDLSSTSLFQSNGGGRLTAVEKSPEQMAADAAEVIFRIRKKRIELITGELGDGAYGAGLKAALEEMDKIEAEYMSLFIGKRFVQTISRTVSVVPEAGKNRITVCRFSDAKGIVSETDLSGRPINIELVAENITNKLAEPTIKKAARWIVYRIPQMNIAKLTDGQEVLSSQRIPVYQSGTTAEMPVVFGL